MTHPLHIVRKLKEAAVKEEDVTIESVEVLEKELMEIKPRLAILSGMIRNLKESPNLEELVTELEKTINNISIHTTRL